jgi:hypothetical protein
MSLTSYRAAPPRAKSVAPIGTGLAISTTNTNAAPRISGAPRSGLDREEGLVLCRSGNDLLSRVLRHSTIGAEAFNGRVRDGIGFGRLAQITGPAKDKLFWPQAPAGPSGPLAIPRISAGAQSRLPACGRGASACLRGKQGFGLGS